MLSQQTGTLKTLSNLIRQQTKKGKTNSKNIKTCI